MRHEADTPRIYLDNAATSWPKPEAVYQAVDDYSRILGAPAGRSGYAEAVVVTQAVEDARRRVAGLVGLADPSGLIFTANGTDSLNLALHGLLAAGDHVVTTVVEHNSVLRPLRYLEDIGQITVTRVDCGAGGVVDPAAVRAAIRPATRLVAIAHASNVTGAIQPVGEISAVAHQAGALLLCDAAQTVGHIEVDMDAQGVDLLAAPGHKGLLGPLGTGVLAIRADVAPRLHSIRQGGTGTESHDTRQPEALPSKFEAGNLNVPGILGLGAGVQYLVARGIDRVHRQGLELTGRLLEGLAAIRGLRIVGPPDAAARVPLVSFVLEGYDPQEVALTLDSAYRIQCRPGLHCAPAMHEWLGTYETGGTVRLSLGPFTTSGEIERVVAAIAELASSEIRI